MAATDYIFVKGIIDVFLVKKKKPSAKNIQLMSVDRRPVTSSEIIGLFEFYLRRWCDEHPGESTVFITDDDGKMIFQATLLDKEDPVLGS